MYESYYGLFRRPFPAAPDAARYCSVGASEQARQTLARCIERAEGPALLVGPSGVGKSLLLNVLAEQYRGRFLIAALNSSGLCTRRALLQNILFELKLPYRDLDEGELRLSLIDRLEPRNSGEGLLLLIDEAHTLPLRLLEEVRLITNLVREGQPRVRLVLAAGPAMEERLANPKLDSFQQRIAARCYLHALNRSECDQYIDSQWTAAGGVSGRVFAPDALRAIFAATDGVPRLVNQLCDHALLLGAAQGRPTLAAAAIEAAWSDLQQLPLPWAPEPQIANVSEVIEFGELGQVAGKTAASTNSFEPEESRFALEFGEVAAAPLTTSAAAQGTEVELIFHAEHQLFGDGFEEEQVVIDHYASLDAETQFVRKRVSCEEGRDIGRALASNAQSKPEIATFTTETEPDLAAFHLAADHSGNENDGIEMETQEIDFDPALDPLSPDPANAGSPVRRAFPLRSLNDDDRDLILIEEGAGETQPPHQPPSRGRRQEYRNLFSTLRNGK